MARGSTRRSPDSPEEGLAPTAPTSALATGARAAPREGTWSTDEELLEALRTRDRRAQVVLFERYHSRIVRVLVRVLGCDDEIEDLAQEAFVGVLQGLPGFRGDAQNLSAWITRIAVYTARGAIRRRSKMRLWRARGDGRPVEGRQAANQETSQLLRHAYRVIEQLPTNERVAFTLRFIDGMELQDVAVACDVSLATVKRLLQRARKRFTSIAARDPWLAEHLPHKQRP